MGYAFRRIIRKLCPHASSRAFWAARRWSSGSLPSVRTRQGPEDSQKAKPNFTLGTAFTSASWRSSAVLMKCAWPRMMLVSCGGVIFTVVKLSMRFTVSYWLVLFYWFCGSSKRQPKELVDLPPIGFCIDMLLGSKYAQPQPNPPVHINRQSRRLQNLNIKEPLKNPRKPITRAGSSVWYERLICNQEVGGSNPPQSTTTNHLLR